MSNAFDPVTHREPTTNEQHTDGPFQRNDRVFMVGTDLYGTVRRHEFLGSRVLVDWDDSTPEEGLRSWIDADYVCLMAVSRG